MYSIENDDFFEAVLRQAVIKNNMDEIEAIPSDEELAKLYTFSERHSKRMKKLFSADKRKETFTVVYKWGKVAVVAICVSATLVFGILLTSAEVRKTVGDVIVTWFEKFTKFQSEESNEEFTKHNWSPRYVPAGYNMLESYEFGSMSVIEYGNQSGSKIELDYMPSDGAISVDNEGREYSVMVENDIVYHLFKAFPEDEHKGNTVVWDMGGYRFTILGYCDIDELLKMAVSTE
jgi:hypothetical protein